MENLRITAVQSDISWHNTEENLARVESLVKNYKASSDLIILPEMFNTGFSMKPEKISERMDGEAADFLRRLSREVNADITGSIAVRENSLYYNRLVWCKPDGRMFTYDKRHLFRMSGEEKVYAAGSELLTVELKGWRIRPFICYDLRFPVWSRNSGLEYDLSVFTANWPASRGPHWDTLLRARAIENQSYVAGINRTGSDGNGNLYDGRSSVIDFCGNTMYQADEGECVFTVELSYSDLISYRESFPAWKDADSFKIL